jgi:protein-disulfide isomerase
MSRKRKRGKSSSSDSTQAATTVEESPEVSIDDSPKLTRKQRRAERVEAQRVARQNATNKNKGIRPWILPGFAGIAVIAIILVGISTLSSDDGGTAGAQVPSPSLGERSAQVVIHEYGDFQCPFCGVFSRSIKPAIQERFIDTGIARLVWHDFAWHGAESDAAANAARCAGDQDRFWEYHDVLFERQGGDNQGAFSNDNLKRFGGIVGLEPEAFESCVDGNTYRGAIAADMSRVRRLGLNGTPSFIIGDQRVIGAQPVEVFEQAILTELQNQG